MAEEKEFEPTIEDFENWTEEKEQAEFERIASANDVKYVIGDNTLFVRTSAGNIYRLPMCPSYAEVSAIQSGTDDDAMEHLCSLIEGGKGGADAIERFKSEPIQTMVEVLKVFGEKLAKAQGATLGE
ncbi:MAG: hypothetical protein Q3X58_00215 [Collinsella sp.]|nr:hypothetical protein [Collinsella sp.]